MKNELQPNAPPCRGGYCVPVDFMERIEIRHDGGVLSVLTGMPKGKPIKARDSVTGKEPDP